MTDHALLLAVTLGLRSPSKPDLPFMIEAAAQSAWSTDHGSPIVAGVIAALCAARLQTSVVRSIFARHGSPHDPPVLGPFDLSVL